jgi:biotin transporter BioY
MQTSYGRHDHRGRHHLAYVLVSTGVIIAFWLAALVIGWFIGRLRQHPREQRGEE